MKNRNKNGKFARHGVHKGYALLALVIVGIVAYSPQNPAVDTYNYGDCQEIAPHEFDCTPQVEKEKLYREALQNGIVWRTGRTVTVTAYTSEKNQTDDTPCIGADGSNLCTRTDHVAACPRDIKLGTKIKLLGTTYTCADRMNQRYTDRVDIYMQHDTRAALQFGIRHNETMEIIR